METEPIRSLPADQRARRIPSDRRDQGTRQRFEQAWRRQQGAPAPQAPAPSELPAPAQLQSDGPVIRRDPDGGLHVDVLA